MIAAFAGPHGPSHHQTIAPTEDKTDSAAGGFAPQALPPFTGVGTSLYPMTIFFARTQSFPSGVMRAR
jgi:hypothetical protein